MKQKRTYLPPNECTRIFGVYVICKEIKLKNDTLLNPCYLCALEPYKMCDNKFSDTRPACFANDPENLSNKPLYFKKYER